MMQYRTKTDDMLDDICYQYYGNSAAVIEVLAANHTLAEQPEKLPAGLIINLPDIISPAQTIDTVRLWD
ncbi:MAG: tail protein X [Methyloprofundus sp.]|nr:tail protein X [Methyloprofundus sp.]